MEKVSYVALVLYSIRTGAYKAVHQRKASACTAENGTKIRPEDQAAWAQKFHAWMKRSVFENIQQKCTYFRGVVIPARLSGNLNKENPASNRQKTQRNLVDMTRYEDLYTRRRLCLEGVMLLRPRCQKPATYNRAFRSCNMSGPAQCWCYLLNHSEGRLISWFEVLCPNPMNRHFKLGNTELKYVLESQGRRMT